MTENLKLPRKLSEERKSPPPQRPSHADVIEILTAGPMKIQRAARCPSGRQDVVQRGAVIALLGEQLDRGGQGFPFGIISFCHARKYQLPISLSTFIICISTYIFRKRLIRPRLQRFSECRIGRGSL